jgi:hypothetical protein
MVAPWVREVRGIERAGEGEKLTLAEGHCSRFGIVPQIEISQRAGPPGDQGAPFS